MQEQVLFLQFVIQLQQIISGDFQALQEDRDILMGLYLLKIHSYYPRIHCIDQPGLTPVIKSHRMKTSSVVLGKLISVRRGGRIFLRESRVFTLPREGVGIFWTHMGRGPGNFTYLVGCLEFFCDKYAQTVAII